MSQPAMRTGFTEALLLQNKGRLHQFKYWVFCPGMLFGDHQQWWGAKTARSTPHEGVDFCCYQNRSGQIVPLGRGVAVPALFSGTVALITPDFLGNSLFIRHSARDCRQGTLYSVYGHLDPHPRLSPGQTVTAGDKIATIAMPPRQKIIAPHLHLSVAWIPAEIPASHLSWAILGRDRQVRLCDPLEYAY